MDLISLLRLVISCICGIAIGFERKNRSKEAGIRTHCIVACASALMMIISKYGFYDLITQVAEGVDIRLDPSRMAQGIVTGVGFLGAGMIYIQRGSIRGLTTASGIWATSGIGMAIGSGMYFIGIAATVVILFLQIFLHGKHRFMTQHKARTLKIYGIEKPEFQDYVTSKLAEVNVSISEVSIRRNEDKSFDYTFYLDMPGEVREETIINKFDHDGQKCYIDFIQ
ncbi:MAG: MgtC/SapB family protein [Clostridia bacterium]|nr:MgtC/SapB family protein [Clostridia bacterium]